MKNAEGKSPFANSRDFGVLRNVGVYSIWLRKPWAIHSIGFEFLNDVNETDKP